MKRQKKQEEGKKSKKVPKVGVKFENDIVVVKPSTIEGAGWGVFSKKRFLKGQVIGEYTGKVYNKETAPLNSMYLVTITKDYFIDGVGKESNSTRYINHSSKPQTENAILKPNVRLKIAEIVCRKRIAPGDEIFYDYG